LNLHNQVHDPRAVGKHRVVGATEAHAVRTSPTLCTGTGCTPSLALAMATAPHLLLLNSAGDEQELSVGEHRPHGRGKLCEVRCIWSGETYTATPHDSQATALTALSIQKK
jgi:hypothetical protein